MVGVFQGANEMTDFKVGGTPVAEVYVGATKVWPTEPEDLWSVIISGIGSHEIPGIAWVHGFGTNEGADHGVYDPANITFVDGAVLSNFDLTNQSPTIDYTTTSGNIQWTVSAQSPLTALSGPWVIYTNTMKEGDNIPPLIFNPEDFAVIVQTSAGSINFPNEPLKENQLLYNWTNFIEGSWDDGMPLEIFLPRVPLEVGRRVVQLAPASVAEGPYTYNMALVIDGDPATFGTIEGPVSPGDPTTNWGQVKFASLNLTANECVDDYVMVVNCSQRSGTVADILSMKNDLVSSRPEQHFSFGSSPEDYTFTPILKGGVLGGGQLIMPAWNDGMEVTFNVDRSSNISQLFWYNISLEVTVVEYDDLTSPVVITPQQHMPILVAASAGWADHGSAAFIDGDVNTRGSNFTQEDFTTQGPANFIPAGSQVLRYEVYLAHGCRYPGEFNSFAWNIHGANGIQGPSMPSTRISYGYTFNFGPLNAATYPEYNNLIGSSAEVIAAWNAIQAYCVHYEREAGNNGGISNGGFLVEVTYATPEGAEVIRKMKMRM